MNNKWHSLETSACAIVALIDKNGRSTHANVALAIDALRKMGHRSGDIHGEGDGCGIATDIPREIWARRLSEYGLSPHLAESRKFFVGHFLLPPSQDSAAKETIHRLKEIIAAGNAKILLELKGATRNNELGPRARLEAPLFCQIAGVLKEIDHQSPSHQLFRMQLQIEDTLPEIHVASLSDTSAVYKLQGVPDLLPRVYPELQDEEMRSIITLGHGRYSTNTTPTVLRSQPFSLIGHNGEINTIDRLRCTGRMRGITFAPEGSDSQDLNRVLEGLIHHYNLDIIQATEMVFPAIYNEVKRYAPDLQGMYHFYRWFWPCSAQGPAAVVARQGDICLGSVDALGLRPLWLVENDTDYLLSSEKGVVDLLHTLTDPRPLAPGEKIAIITRRGHRTEIWDYRKIQDYLVEQHKTRQQTGKQLGSLYHAIPHPEPTSMKGPFRFEGLKPKIHHPVNLLAALGWRKYDFDIRQRVSLEGREVIGSLGHTGPLSVFVPESLPNVADFCKENVAVVTNPAIDREREAEHFSTRVVLGRRPVLDDEKESLPFGLELRTPLILGGYKAGDGLDTDQERAIASDFGTYLFEDVLAFFTSQWNDQDRVAILDATVSLEAGLEDRLKSLCAEAEAAIDNGATLLVLNDSGSYSNGRVNIDPALAISSVHVFLTDRQLRSEVGVVVRSASIRNLHDIVVLLGLGADALNPYCLWEVSIDCVKEEQTSSAALVNTLQVLQKGIEKVMSTMGIHELGGYGRIFSSIGLTDELASLLRIVDFCPSKEAGLSYKQLEAMARKRYELAHEPEERPLYKELPRNPKVGKILRDTALGKKGYSEMSTELAHIDESLPIGIRHIMAFKTAPEQDRPGMEEVDISVGPHDMPLLIAAMSFGSQGENSFRIYAEAAKRANIICINGEGGEIPDMLGKYRKNRCQQIASGRFGVFLRFLNSTEYLEIKIGQGAKPGEGGHLPGNKVSETVATARHCKPGITLISPSNHHDIYSIEDLAQVITELKTAHPQVKISVKIPVTTGVGTIAVGVAKAGADVINISGFEGGTGAAREHAKRYAGLPAEIGVSEAHRALVESDLRSSVEIWADGGMRSGADVLKMILLGANRIGFGTPVLMGIGCISCRRCHLDRCPRGISTQIPSVEKAQRLGVKGFLPRIVEDETENLSRLLLAIGQEIRMHLAALGFRTLQELVGRTDLLYQYRMTDRVSITNILATAIPPPFTNSKALPPVTRKPLSYLTRLISDLAMARIDEGDKTINFVEDNVHSSDRAVGTYLAGVVERKFGETIDCKTYLRMPASIPGNGLCAFSNKSIEAVVEGGSQDGAGKGNFGGRLVILKGQNILGKRVDGSVGKSFAYGAIGGLFIVQNMADSRACVRLSGADVVFGGRITAQVNDIGGNMASRAHLKGFAFEYMTGGRAVVLGDPGPWMCAGMTGGVIYQCLYPEHNFESGAIRRRLAKGANVSLQKLTETGFADVKELLELYVADLDRSFQREEAQAVSEILAHANDRFIMIVPKPLKTASAE